MCPPIYRFFRKKIFDWNDATNLGAHVAYIDRYVASRIVRMLPVFLTPLGASTELTRY